MFNPSEANFILLAELLCDRRQLTIVGIPLGTKWLLAGLLDCGDDYWGELTAPIALKKVVNRSRKLTLNWVWCVPRVVWC